MVRVPKRKRKETKRETDEKGTLSVCVKSLGDKTKTFLVSQRWSSEEVVVKEQLFVMSAPKAILGELGVCWVQQNCVLANATGGMWGSTTVGANGNPVFPTPRLFSSEDSNGAR